MANWCNNIVTFEGTEEQIQKVDAIFQKMIDKETQEECGQLPPFVKEGNLYSFYIEQIDIGIYRFCTKWLPNINEVFQIAKKAGIKDYTHEYEELGWLMYGKAIYTNKKLIDYQLGSEDFEKYEFNEDECTYTFAGEIYQSEWEILEILLEDRINSTNVIKQ